MKEIFIEDLNRIEKEYSKKYRLYNSKKSFK